MYNHLTVQYLMPSTSPIILTPILTPIIIIDETTEHLSIISIIIATTHTRLVATAVIGLFTTGAITLTHGNCPTRTHVIRPPRHNSIRPTGPVYRSQQSRPPSTMIIITIIITITIIIVTDIDDQLTKFPRYPRVSSVLISASARVGKCFTRLTDCR